MAPSPILAPKPKATKPKKSAHYGSQVSHTSVSAGNKRKPVERDLNKPEHAKTNRPAHRAQKSKKDAPVPMSSAESKKRKEKERAKERDRIEKEISGKHSHRGHSYHKNSTSYHGRDGGHREYSSVSQKSRKIDKQQSYSRSNRD